MKNLLLLVVFANLIFLGCQKSNFQSSFQLVQEENDNKAQFATWLEQNTVIIDYKYVTDDGFIGILYENKQTNQRFFVPTVEINTKEKPTNVSYDKALDFDAINYFVECAYSGSCCAVYSDPGEGATIRINPKCVNF